MVLKLQHDLKLDATSDEQARQGFTSALRAFVLNDMAADMATRYAAEVEPQAAAAPSNAAEVHEAIKDDLYFKLYSSIRVNAQEMVWDAVRPTLEREGRALNARVKGINEQPQAPGSLEVPGMPTPDSVKVVDVHLMPGNYHSEHGDDDATGGALYDNGLAVFSFGLMGRNLDDIGQSISTFIKARYPDFAPDSILDTGCTIGHNTCAWAERYPHAEVHGIDVAAPGLRYGLARARLQGKAVHFHQRNAESNGFGDNSFDLVFSSMFLHEVPADGIRKVFDEAYRVLKPGGLMLHMELPPNDSLKPYDQFYLDWDCWYNNEPYYKAFRDMSTRQLCEAAGFAKDDYEEFIIPSISWYGEQAVLDAVTAQAGFDDKTGRLADGISWFCFGAWKR